MNSNENWYDVMLEPKNVPGTALGQGNGTAENSGYIINAIIMEFKVQDEDEKGLSDTVQEALRQIDVKNYQASFMAKGIPEGCIKKYGFAFCGKKCL